MESFFPSSANPSVILNSQHHQPNQLYLPTPSPILQGFDHNDINVDVNNYIPMQNPMLESAPSYTPSSYEDTWSLGCVALHLNPNQENQITKSDSTRCYTVDKIINPTTTLQQYECQLVEPNVPKFSESIQDYVCSIPYPYAYQEHEAPAKIQCYPSSIYPQDQIVAANQMEYIDAIMSSLPTSTSVSSSQIVTTPITPSSLEP